MRLNEGRIKGEESLLETHPRLFSHCELGFGFFLGVLWGADRWPFEAAEGSVDPEVQSGLHGVVFVVGPAKEQQRSVSVGLEEGKPF